MNLGRNSSVGNFNIREQLSIGSCQISKQEDVSDRFPLFLKTSVSKQDKFLAVGSDLETSELKSHTSEITHFEYNVFSSHAPYNTPPGAFGEVVLKLENFDASVLSVGFNCSITSGSEYFVGDYYIISHIDEANEKVTLAFLYNSLTDEQANTFPDAMSYGEVNGYTFQIFSKTTYNFTTNEFTCNHLNTTTSTHENLRVKSVALESDGFSDATISNYEGMLAIHPNLTVPYDIICGSLYQGKNMHLTGGITSTLLNLKSDGYADAEIVNHEGRVSVVDLRSANLVVAEGKVETPEIRLFNASGPDAIISNYQGRVNVENIGAANEVVANGSLIGGQLTVSGAANCLSLHIVSDGHPNAVLTNFQGKTNTNSLIVQQDILSMSLHATNEVQTNKIQASGTVQIGSFEILQKNKNEIVFQKAIDVNLFSIQWGGISGTLGTFTVMYDIFEGTPDLSLFTIGDKTQLLKTDQAPDLTTFQGVSTEYVTNTDFTINGVDTNQRYIIISFPVSDYTSRGFQASHPLSSTPASQPDSVAANWFLRRTSQVSIDMASRNSTWVRSSLP